MNKKLWSLIFAFVLCGVMQGQEKSSAVKRSKSITIRLKDGVEFPVNRVSFEMLKKYSQTIRDDFAAAKEGVLLLAELTEPEFIQILKWVKLIPTPEQLKKSIEKLPSKMGRRYFELARFLDIGPLMGALAEYGIEKGMINIILKDGIVYQKNNMGNRNKIDNFIAASSVLKTMKEDLGIDYERIDISALTKNQFEKLYALRFILNNPKELAQQFADRTLYAGALSLALILSAADFLHIESVVDAAADEISKRLAEPAALNEFKNGRKWGSFLRLSPQAQAMIAEKLSAYLGAIAQPTLIESFPASGINLEYFSKPDELLFAQKGDKVIKILKAKTGELLHELKTGAVDSYCLSKDGTLLATQSGNRIKIWQVKNEKLIQDFQVDDIENLVSFSPDNAKLLTQLNLLGVAVYDLKTQNLLYTLRSPGGPLREVVWSPDSKLLILASLVGLRLFNAQTGEEFFPQDDFIDMAVWDRDGTLLVLVILPKDDLSIKILIARKGSLIREFKNNRSVEKISLSPNGNLLAVEDDRGVVTILSTQTGKLIHTIPTSKYPIQQLSWSANNEVLAIASGDHQGGIIRFWDVRSATFFYEIPSKEYLRNILWSADGMQLQLVFVTKIAYWEFRLLDLLDLDQVMLILLIKHEYEKNKKIELTSALKEIYDTLPESIKKLLKENYRI